MGLFSFLQPGRRSIKTVFQKGAIIIDVRTPQEYDRGHIPDAFNIPVDRIKASSNRIKASNVPVIVCCNNGERSSIAFQFLKSAGIKEVYKGGNWEKLLEAIS